MEKIRAVVNQTVCPIQLKSAVKGEMADEAVYGMTVTVVDYDGEFAFIETDYDYKGYILKEYLETDKDRVKAWDEAEKSVVWHSFADCQHEPSYKSWPAAKVVRGSYVVLTGKTEGDWSEIKLVSGENAWLKTEYVKPIKKVSDYGNEVDLRNALVDTAILYLDTQYRWGGRSPLGVDCSGLCSMSYLLNGIKIYRDAHLKPEYMDEITLEEAKPGDLLFFPGHVAMYLGSRRYIHSSSSVSGVKFGSLNPEDLNYSQKLHDTLEACGTVFKGDRLKWK